MICNKKKHFIILPLFLMSFILIFLSGSYNSLTNFDISSRYFADVSLNHTKNNKISSLIVEQKDKNHELIDTAVEFNEINRFIHNKNNCFVGAVNADKSHQIYIDKIETEALSFVYVARAGFNNKKIGDNIWQHEYYPLNLMFDGKAPILPGSFSFCYISQSQADKILKSRKIISHTRSDYESLLGTDINISFDSQMLNWTILDIYYESGNYYESIKNVMGEFLLGYNKYPINFNKQSVYFMNEYEFVNRHILKHTLNNYSYDNYRYCIGNYNINSGFVIDYSQAFSAMNAYTQPSFYIICVFSIVLIFFGLFLIWRLKYFYIKHNLFICVSIVFIPCLLFKIFFVITNNIFFYSTISAFLNLILIIVVIILLLIILINSYRKYKSIKKN